MDRTAARQRCASAGDVRRRRALATLCAVLVIVISVVTLCVRVGPGPAWLGKTASAWAAAHGVPFTVEAVQLMGWGTAVLRGVTYQAPEGSRVVAFSADAVTVFFDPLVLLRGGGTAAVRELVVTGSRLTLAPLTGGAASSDGQEATSAVTGGNRGPGKATSAAGPWLPHVSALGVRVAVRDGRVSGAGDRSVSVSVRELAGTLRRDGVSVQHVAADIAAAGGTWHLAAGEAELRIGEAGLSVASLTGKMDGGHVQLSGTIGWNTALDLAVSATFDDLAAGLPFLTVHGFEGPGTFTGRLTGTVGSWELQGESSVGPGKVWGRENVTGTGGLRVSAAGIDFRNVVLHQYGGTYRLNGSWRFGSGGERGSLDLRLEAESARLQEVLDLMGWQAPVTGRLSGELNFSGPIGRVAVRGDAVVAEAVAWQQPLDRISGTFTWDGGQLHLSEAELQLGSGIARLAGEVDIAGRRVDLAFTADDWPLGFTDLFEQRFGDAVGGMVSIRGGRLSGTPDAPEMSGEIAADVLRVGPAYFRSVQGHLAYGAGVLELSDFAGIRAGGGRYVLSGSVTLPPEGGPAADLTLDVRAERLRSLLQLAGEDLPATLLDGHVSGRIRVSGALRDPEAQLDLELVETAVMKRGVRVAMRYADGGLTVQELDFSPDAATSG